MLSDKVKTVIRPHRAATSPELDPSSLSNYTQFEIGTVILKFAVDFDKCVAAGTVRYDLVPRGPVAEVVLDTSYLTIVSVSVDCAPVEYTLAPRKGPLGAPLTVPLLGDQRTSVEIAFETTSQCTALQFLDKEATDGKTLPYLFSQCQAIHARSLFPCFDTPSVKCAYEFETTSPLPTIMSGRPCGVDGNVYRFSQPIPIPTYLVAIASGDIAKLPIGKLSHVYCEPKNLRACQHEFEADMESFLVAAESLVSPYAWDQYDVLVLPLSFPYGGMENPNATFVTPTLISGDRQNVDVIAHELAHSWLGNLVTNCSWEHFWLNEGWTVYLERRILSRIHGEPTGHFSAIIGWSDLEKSIRAMGDSATRYSTLVQNLKDGSDPDDAFSKVPYEKGFNLLFLIEQTVGGIDAFDPFVHHYFKTFEYKSLDTYQFLDELYAFFADKTAQLDTIDWHTWLYEPGMPPTKPNFDTSMVDACYALADRWYRALEKNADYHALFSPLDIAGFTANQNVVFLDTLASCDKSGSVAWTQDALRALDDIYRAYASNKNAEVLFRWFVVQVQGRNSAYYPRLGEWLGTVGRMKFVRPGYLLLKEVDAAMALKYFGRFEKRYHPICRAMIRKDLGLA